MLEEQLRLSTAVVHARTRSAKEALQADAEEQRKDALMRVPRAWVSSAGCGGSGGAELGWASGFYLGFCSQELPAWAR